MAKMLAFFGNPPTPSSALTAERIAEICGNSPEALEEGLLVATMELLEFLGREHAPGEAAELAETVLAGVAWALSERIGAWPSAGLQDRILLQAARRVGGEIEHAMRAHLHFENKLAEEERKLLQEENPHTTWEEALRDLIRALRSMDLEEGEGPTGEEN